MVLKNAAVETENWELKNEDAIIPAKVHVTQRKFVGRDAQSRLLAGVFSQLYAETAVDKRVSCAVYMCAYQFLIPQSAAKIVNRLFAIHPSNLARGVSSNCHLCQIH
jgi:hypothetical protein